MTSLLVVGMLLAASAITTAFAAGDHAYQFDWQPPTFTATTASGELFHYPEDLQGPTIVLFWATWCPYCKALMPHLQSILDEYGDDVQVLALNFREDEDPVEFMADYGYEFLLIPAADEVAGSWGIKGTPGLFLAERSGRVVFSRGAIPEQAYPAERFANNEALKHFQKAARVAPFWAARLREALDGLLQSDSAPVATDQAVEP
jgi:thiol-disulfide isomerase/thioredoxin